MGWDGQGVEVGGSRKMCAMSFGMKWNEPLFVTCKIRQAKISFEQKLCSTQKVSPVIFQTTVRAAQPSHAACWHDY